MASTALVLQSSLMLILMHSSLIMLLLLLSPHSNSKIMHSSRGPGPPPQLGPRHNSRETESRLQLGQRPPCTLQQQLPSEVDSAPWILSSREVALTGAMQCLAVFLMEIKPWEMVQDKAVMHPDLQILSQSMIAMMRYVHKCLIIVMVPRLLLLLLAILSRTLEGQQSVAGKFR